MPDYINPFEHEAAAHLPPEMVLDMFVEDHNYTRFIRSPRHLFLMGERGSGKSMTLLYNSFKYQLLKARKTYIEPTLENIGIYIPCNTPLTHRQEHRLIANDYHAALISEQYLVISILHAIATTLQELPDLIEKQLDDNLKSEIESLLGIELDKERPLLNALELFSQHEAARVQKAVNSSRIEVAYEGALTFFVAVLPILKALRQVPRLKHSHFMLLIDDAHDLNHFQRAALNSWIAYRGQPLFSLKVAVAKIGNFDYRTFSGGTILEGHDFITIDLEQRFQNLQSPFAKLAHDIIEKRLQLAGITASPESFFPTSPEMLADLERAKDKARQDAKKKYPDGSPKVIADYVYKYARAEYFRGRSSKANLPPYSGLESIIHISTGVTRNLLDPCYWMYDDVYSESGKEGTPILSIPPNVQTKVLLRRSEAMWNFLRDGLHKSVENCTAAQGTQLYRLLDNLAILFRQRLMGHKSEPRAIAFTISGMQQDQEAILKPLLEIARRAQVLYTRYGPAKDDGKREPYYVPNRILWPTRGLDPNGQHARVSLKATAIIAACDGTPFPFSPEDVEEDSQGGLFDGNI